MISILHLPDVLLYLLVLVFVFGIIGNFQFEGNYYYRCRLTPEPVNGVWEIDRNVTRFCSAYGYGDYDCPKDRYCGHPDMYGLSLKNENISDMVETYYFAVGYDMIIKSVLAHIQILTIEGWVDMMYKTSDTMNSVFARFFFPIFICVCAFFTLNFIVAVIVDSLLKNKQQEEEQISNDTSVIASCPDSEVLKKPVSQRHSEFNSEKQVSEVVETRRELLKASSRISSRSIIAAMSEQAPETNVTEVKAESPKKKVLNFLVAVVVLGNCIAMCFDHLEIPDSEVKWLDIMDTVFFALFIIEMFIRMYMEGICRYFYNGPNNIMDVVINIFGIIEVSLTHSKLSMNYYWRGAIVIMRVLRALKLVSKVEILKETLTFIWITLHEIIDFMILLALFVCIYTVMGMELFAGRVKFNSSNMLDLKNGESPTYNFDNLENALIASYTFVVGDNWSSFLYMYTRVNYTIGTLYFYTGIYVLNIFMVNVFLAIILQNFYVDEQKKKWEEEEKKNNEYAEKLKRIRISSDGDGYRNREGVLLVALKIFRTVISLNKMCKERKKKTKSVLTGVVMFLLSDDNAFRIICHKIITSKIFIVISHVFSIAITIVITFEIPLYDPNGTTIKIAKIISIILLVFFILEIMINIASYGLIFNGEDSYLRSPCNVIDCISTIALIIQLSTACSSDVAYGQVIMILVILRILRLTTIKDGFSLSIKAIIKGFPSILSTLGVGTLFFFILSAVGIHFFKGMLHFCDTSSMDMNSTTLKSFNMFDCMNHGGEWKNTDVSFDNIFLSFLTLFELMTAKSWWLLVTNLAKYYDLNKDYKENISYKTSLFVVMCTIVGFLYIRAIITGLINFAFCNQKEEIQGIKNLKYLQRKWAGFSKVIFKAAPIRQVTL